MTNGDRIRSMTDTQLAYSGLLTCRHCIYDRFVDDSDPWHCTKLGWDCYYGREMWLQQEEQPRREVPR